MSGSDQLQTFMELGNRYAGFNRLGNGFFGDDFGHGKLGCISGSTTYYPICTLPAEYAPHHEVIVLQQGSDRSIWMLRIFRRDHADYPCKVMFSRYRSGSSWASAATTAWLPFHATWIV